MLVLYLYLALTPPAKSPTLNLDVKHWEQRLGADTFREREQAQKELIAYGRHGIPILRALQKDSRDLLGNWLKDPEVLKRAAEIDHAYENRVWCQLATFHPYPEIDVFWYSWKDNCYNSSLPGYKLYCPKYYEIPPNLNDVDETLSTFYRFYGGYRKATIILFRDQLVKGTPMWQLRLWWLWMHVVDHKAGWGYWQPELYRLKTLWHICKNMQRTYEE